MDQDVLTRLAKVRVIAMSEQLEALLADKRGGNIVVEVVNRLRDRAAESMTALSICDPTDINKVIIYQNEVKRYDEFFMCLRKIVQDGIEADRDLSQQDREDMIDILVNTAEGQREAQELGLLNLD